MTIRGYFFNIATFIARDAKQLPSLAENNPLHLLWVIPAKEKLIMLTPAIIKNSSFFFQRAQKKSFLLPLLDANKHNLQKIYNHPFNLQLFDGTLNALVFGQYLRDDYFYLHHFSSVLKTLSTRSNQFNPSLAHNLSYLAKNIIAGEQEMQLKYEEYLNIPNDYNPGLAISSYVNFLTKNAEQAKLPAALSSVLPCFWIYCKLGSSPLKHNQLKFNPYKKWIATYSGSEFIEATQQLANTIDYLGRQSSSELQRELSVAFSKAVQYELEFFDESFYHHTNKNTAAYVS